MNDEINTPSKVYNLLNSNNIPIIFKPGEIQNLNSLFLVICIGTHRP